MLRWDNLEYAVEMQRKRPDHSYSVSDQRGKPLYGRYVPGTECAYYYIMLTEIEDA